MRFICLFLMMLFAGTAKAGADVGADRYFGDDRQYKLWIDIDEKIANFKDYGLNIYSQHEVDLDYSNTYSQLSLYRDFKYVSVRAMYINDIYSPNTGSREHGRRYGVGVKFRLWN